MLKTVLLMMLASFATALYLMVTRRRNIPSIDLDLNQVPDIKTGLSQIAGLTGSPVLEGNEAELYQNGDLLEEMIRAIESAQHSIHLETFVWTTGELEERLVNLLGEKAKQGLIVRVLVDAVGGMKASDAQMAKLREDGVHLAFYHPFKILSFRRFNSRTHRKLLITDAETAFVFGHGIADAWCGQAQDKYHWRDTGVRLRGSLVCELQVIFFHDWIEAGQKVPIGEMAFLEDQSPEGSIPAHVVSSSNRGGHSAVALLYILAIASARSEIIIQNPYFAPERGIPKLLAQMVARGVDVHLMVPGDVTDSRVLQRASKALYGPLLRSGVRLYEYNATLLHQKIVIVDKVWSHIGSTNFDARSLALNAEIGVGLLDSGIAGELRKAFENDLSHSEELTLEQWKTTPWYKHLLYWCTYQLHDHL